jgi:hypothetical protein
MVRMAKWIPVSLIEKYPMMTAKRPDMKGAANSPIKAGSLSFTTRIAKV